MNHEAPINIETLCSIFSEFSDLLSETVPILPSPEYQNDLESYIKYLFIIRQKSNLKAIQHLLQEYSVDPDLKIPIFLIVRTCLSDTLTLLYFIKIIKNEYPDKQAIEKKINGYLVDHLYRLQNDIKKRKELNEIDGKEYEKLSEIMKIKFPNFFNDESKLIEKICPNFSKISEEIKEDPKLSWTSKAYDYYNYLSKVEHVGILTLEIQGQTDFLKDYDNKGILLSFGIIFDIFYTIIKPLVNQEILIKLEAFKYKLSKT